MVLLAAFLAFTSVALVAYGLRTGREDPLRVRLRALRGESLRRALPDLDLPFTTRVLNPVLADIGRKFLLFFPPSWVKRLEWRLVAAGSPTSIAGFLLVWVVTAVTLPLAIITILVLGGAPVNLLTVVAVLAVLGLSVSGPGLWLNLRLRSRQREILRQLPDALDLLSTSVEAGLGLDAALRRVAEDMPGSLSEEIMRALSEVAVGRARQEALLGIASRTGVSDLANFLHTLVQAMSTGVAITQTLQAQGEMVRLKRRQRAEAHARRAPVLLLIPLILFIFPSMLVVTLGPAMINIWDSLRGLPTT